MKFYITGSTRGLGNYLADYFECVRIDKPIDLNKDVEEVTASIEQGSTVILNAYASQLEYVKQLKDKCSIIVCGSIASVNPDNEMLEYSENKQALEDEVTQLALHSKFPILYLRLTSSSYKDYDLIARSIKFWLSNPDVTFIGYNIHE